MSKNKIDETFIKEQHTFTQHIRDPENAREHLKALSQDVYLYIQILFFVILKILLQIAFLF